MFEKKLTPWAVEPADTDDHFHSMEINNSPSAVFCSTLKNLAQPLGESLTIGPNKKFSGTKRVKSALCRYRSQQLPLFQQEKNCCKSKTLKLQIQRLESIQYLSLSQKQPLPRKQPPKPRRQRISSATVRSHSQKKRVLTNYNNLGRFAHQTVKEEEILISEKIQNLIKITQSRSNCSKLSSKINSIIKGYVNIPITAIGRDSKEYRQQFVRELFTQRM